MNCVSCGKDLLTGDTPGMCSNCYNKRGGDFPYTCPVCSGSGLVSRPPYIAGDQPTWTTKDTGTYQCKTCKGTGVLWH